MGRLCFFGWGDSMRFLLFLPILCVSVCLTGGCGSNKVKVSGKVTVEGGGVVESGTVTFSSPTYQVSGDIQKDGTYRLGEIRDGDGIKPGTYRVSVNGPYIPGPPDPKNPYSRGTPLLAENWSKEVTVDKSMTVDLPVPAYEPPAK